MPVSLQVKLLRVLQERVVRRVGGKVNHSVDIRIIAASNRNLRELVAQGAFREDLFFRLDVIPLFVPPLRERQGDIRLLVAHFLQSFSRERGCTYRVATELMHAFEAYPWPGNVRELKNFVEYGVGFCEHGVLTLDLMDSRFKTASPPPVKTEKGMPSPPPGPARDTAEYDRIMQLLGRYGAHGRKNGRPPNWDQPCHALPQDGAAGHHGEKAREMTEGSPFLQDTAATAGPVAILCMAGHCLFQALTAFSRPAQRRERAAFPSVISNPPQPAWGKHPGCASSHALPGDMAGRTDRAGISETGEPVRTGGRMDRMPVAISSEIAPCRKQP